MSAPKGNTNRRGKRKSDEEKVPPAHVTSISLNHYRFERLRNAIVWNEGYLPEDSEVQSKARELAYHGIDTYCESIKNTRVQETEVN